jgi:RimJ/RimL family protein N-acetyltransferase
MNATVLPFDPRQATRSELADYFAVRLASSVETRPLDPAPTFESVVDRITRPPAAARRVQHWVARDGAAIVGLAQLVLPDGENAGVGFVAVDVAREYRQRGIGSALLRGAARTVAAEGRPLVMAEGVIAETTGAAWARSRGFVLAQSTVLQSLRLPHAASARWPTDVPSGYRLVQWTARAPEDLVSSYALAKRAIADAPTGDLAIEFPDWTVARVREREESLRERGGEGRVVVAIQEQTGAVVGLTEIERFDRAPTQAMQQDTVVVPEHRGHGLGLAMKARMLEWLTAERPEIELVRTSTAAGNEHMIRVNQKLGFTVDYEAHNYQIETAVIARSTAP